MSRFEWKSKAGKGVVFFDLASATLIIAVMLHVCLVAIELQDAKAAALVEREVLLAKTAAYADFLVKAGLAEKKGDAVLQHRLGGEELMKIGELEQQAEEFGLRNANIRVGSRETAGERSLLGKEQGTLVCITRLALKGKEIEKVVVCAGGLG